MSNAVMAANATPVFRQVEGRTTTSFNSLFKMYRDADTSLPFSSTFVNVTRIPQSAVQVRAPLWVRLESDGDDYYASSPISLIYEIGSTRKEALMSYLDALADHFEWLTEEEEQGALAPTTQQELDLLRLYLFV